MEEFQNIILNENIYPPINGYISLFQAIKYYSGLIIVLHGNECVQILG